MKRKSIGSGEGGQETMKYKGGESQECSFVYIRYCVGNKEKLFLAGNFAFVQPALTFVTFEKKSVFNLNFSEKILLYSSKKGKQRVW